MAELGTDRNEGEGATPLAGAPAGAILEGTAGDDVLTGTAGPDQINDSWGDDIIDGGDGDDLIVDGGGSNTLRGGGGNDIIRLGENPSRRLEYGFTETNLIDGGDGDDQVWIPGGAGEKIRVDLGSGHDLLTVEARIGFDDDIVVTTGPGADRIVFDFNYGDMLRFTIGRPPVVVTDFTPGSGGDVLDLAALLKGALSFTEVAANPFADAHLRLVQDGPDTLVRIDFDGIGPGGSSTYIRDLARLANVDAKTLTAENFAGFDPHGGDPEHDSASGTSGDDWLLADVAGSDLFGLGGNDRLTGSVEADRLDGGDGNDVIEGGDGDDLLRGGAGDDVLTDRSGNDTFEGGAGNDLIDIYRPMLPFYLPARRETIGIDAGDGDDLVRFVTAPDTEGHGVDRRSYDLRVDLGAGNDRFELSNYVAGARLTLGAGQDQVVLGGSFYTHQEYGDVTDTTAFPPLLVTDFTPGDGGDQIDVRLALAMDGGWNGSWNPFATGHLRLVQSGADTLILNDYDGYGSGNYVLTLARLANVAASSLTAFNLAGLAPDGSPLPPGPPATDGNDHLVGTAADDIIDGGPGDDLIEDLRGGSDRLSGGDGNDRIVVSHGYGSIFAPGTMTIDGGAGDDVVDFGDYYSHLDARLGSGDDRIILRSNGGLGASLTLGEGSDTIVLPMGLDGQSSEPVAVIEDFQPGDGGDRIDWIAYAEAALIKSSPKIDPTFSVPDFNPFLTGEARLFQSGADTLLQIRPGAATAPGPYYLTLLTFRNVDAASFTEFNLGYRPFSTTWQGGDGDDTFAGTPGVDVLDGGNGADTLSGAAGDDILRGGDGRDILVGGSGRDRLEGGAGDDRLDGGDDADRLAGGAGRDSVDGGGGNDSIIDLDGLDSIEGGSGDDTIYVSTAYESLSVPAGSIRAGDGNDRVTVTGSNSPGYTIDLGAGDDYLSLQRSVASVLLGPGRDTIATGGAVDLPDFEPGDQGDIFDIATYGASILRFSLGSVLLSNGDNPFALGYFRLVQVGNDVELRAYPSGIPDDGTFDAAPVRFFNTRVEQFTAANFGGFDPHATPALPLIVREDTAIAAGTTIVATNVTPFFDRSTEIVLQGPGDVHFVNHGTIVASLTRGGLGYLTGIAIGDFVGSGAFVNAVDGRFSVDSRFIDESGRIDVGWTYGFYNDSLRTVLFRNDGRFEVRAASGSIDAVTTFYDAVNTGTLIVDAPKDAYGFVLGADSRWSNSGSISVHGGRSATGVYLDGIRDARLVNSGDLEVSVDLGSPYASVGFFIAEAGERPGGYEFVNRGRVDADIAYYVWDFATSALPADRLINSGTIDGAIMLSNGDDLVVNSGTISGRTLLGAGADRYEGGEGRQLGSIEGGTGNDVLIGGDGAEELYGDSGNDIIHGGGGDDYVEGGTGSDRLEGGAGIDILSYLGSPLAIVADLAAGTVADGQSTDLVGGFETLIGSRGADRIAGSAAADTLIGYLGADRLDGRGGDDVLVGGGGDDILSGGAGNDRFLFSRSDGRDVIEDFAPGDRIEIYGYAAAQSVAADGADVLVTLSGSDSLRIRNTSVAAVASALSFSAEPLDLALASIADEPIVSREDFVLGAGVEMRLSNPRPIAPGPPTGASYALLLEAAGDGPTPSFFNAGLLAIADAGPRNVVGVTRAGAYGDDRSAVVNAVGATISVQSAAAPAIGIDFVDAVWNLGAITVRSLYGDASGIWGNGLASDFAQLLNAGTISVDAKGSAAGLAQNPGTSRTGARLFNSGALIVHGGAASFGIDYRGGSVSPGSPDVVVNSGTIRVTDGTAAADSAGIRYDVFGAARIWNSGTIEAEHAFLRVNGSSGATVGAFLEIFNSGRILGRFDASGGLFALDTRLVNTGTMLGDVAFGTGNDLYDGRAGALAGNISGGGGNDVLLAGAGDQQIDGDYGDDILSGGAGDDRLTGGLGADTFRFGVGFGTDTIADFGTGDRVVVEGYSGWTSIVQQGADVVVSFGGSDRLVFAGRSLAAITADLFTFGAAAIAATAVPDAPQPAAAPSAPTPAASAPSVNPIDGSAASEDLAGTAGADLVYGNAGDDIVWLQQGGADEVHGGSGQDGLFFGAALDAADRVDGGDGVDTLALQGDYADLLLSGVTSVEVILLASGSDTRFGDAGGHSYDYHLRTADANVPAGGTLTVSATLLRSGEDVVFDGSAESDGDLVVFAGSGTDRLVGGAGTDGFFFGADGNFTGADRIVGGGGVDSVALRGAYSGAGAVHLQEASFASIEVLTFLSGHTNEYGGPIVAAGFDYDATMADGNVAAGQLLQVIAVTLRADESLRFDGRAESDGSFRILSGAGDDMLYGGAGSDIIYGGLGADRLEGGAGADVYLYRFAAESTAASRDTILFGAGDRIDLSAIDANATTAANDAFAFIGASAFSHVAGELRVFQSGGSWFVEGDTNGDGVADLALAVTSAAPLAATDFVL